MQILKAKVPTILLSLFWLVLISAAFIYFGISFTEVYQKVIELQFHIESYFFLVLTLLLWLPNIGLEAAKWRLSLTGIERISFFKAVQSTLAGMSVSVWMPNRIGEYLGRIFHLQPKNQLSGALSSLFTSVVQFSVTSFFGLLGLVYYSSQHAFSFFALEIGLASAGLLALLLLLFNRTWLKKLFKKYLPAKSYQLIKIIIWSFSRYPNTLVVKMFVLATLRYLIFSLQYILLLWAFGMPLPWLEAFLLIALIYGVQSLVPASALVQLGARGAIAVWAFHEAPFFSASAILSASYLLWIINVLLPGFVGLIFLILIPQKLKAVLMLKFKWFQSKSAKV